MHRTSTSPSSSGNYNLATTCSAGHVTYKDQMHPNAPYKCGQVTNPATNAKCEKPI